MDSELGDQRESLWVQCQPPGGFRQSSCSRVNEEVLVWWQWDADGTEWLQGVAVP